MGGGESKEQEPRDLCDEAANRETESWKSFDNNSEFPERIIDFCIISIYGVPSDVRKDENREYHLEIFDEYINNINTKLGTSFINRINSDDFEKDLIDTKNNSSRLKNIIQSIDGNIKYSGTQLPVKTVEDLTSKCNYINSFLSNLIEKFGKEGVKNKSLTNFYNEYSLGSINNIYISDSNTPHKATIRPNFSNDNLIYLHYFFLHYNDKAQDLLYSNNKGHIGMNGKLPRYHRGRNAYSSSTFSVDNYSNKYTEYTNVINRYRTLHNSHYIHILNNINSLGNLIVNIMDSINNRIINFKSALRPDEIGLFETLKKLVGDILNGFGSGYIGGGSVNQAINERIRDCDNYFTKLNQTDTLKKFNEKYEFNCVKNKSNNTTHMYLGYKNQPINGVNYSEYLLNPIGDGTDAEQVAEPVAKSGHLCVKSNSAEECFDYRNLAICETYLKKYKDDKGEIINFNLGSGPHSSFTKSPIFENPDNLNTIKDQEIFSYNAKLWNAKSKLHKTGFSNTNQEQVNKLDNMPNIVTTTTVPDITTTTTDYTHEEKKRFTQPEPTSPPSGYPEPDIPTGKYHLKVKCSDNNDYDYGFLYFNRDNNQNFYHLAIKSGRGSIDDASDIFEVNNHFPMIDNKRISVISIKLQGTDIYLISKPAEEPLKGLLQCSEFPHPLSTDGNQELYFIASNVTSTESGYEFKMSSANRQDKFCSVFPSPQSDEIFNSINTNNKLYDYITSNHPKYHCDFNSSDCIFKLVRTQN